MADFLVEDVETELRRLISGVEVGAKFDVDPASGLCAGLERFVPAALRSNYPKWRGESLDMLDLVTTVTSASTARLLGLALLVSVQAWTPVLLDLRFSLDRQTIARIDMRLGEAGGGPIGISGASYGTDAASRLRYDLPARVDSVVWKYRASMTFQQLTYRAYNVVV